MDKATLRILGKFGFVLVFIGFFMPISCNLNGFQLANTFQTLGGTNILSICLYLIFIASCFGIFLLIPALLKMPVSKLEGLPIYVIGFSIIVFVADYTGTNKISIMDYISQLQIGAYIIVAGTIFTIVMEDKFNALINKTKKEEKTEEHGQIAPTSDENTFCPQCGSKLPTNTKFCSKCGAKIQ